MALSHSSKIVTDGLVFAYDMANTQKSWKGAPATNLLINSVIPFANIYNFPNSTGVITQNYRQAPDGTNTAQQLSSTGTGLGTQFYTYVTTTTPSGTVYTFSFYTLSSSQTGWTIGGVGINQCTINSTTNTLLPNGWYRWSVVVTTTANNAIIALMAQVSIGTTIIVWGGQIELGSFATPLIPTISSTASRSNTQALVDLVGNNTVTANSLTYNANNTFSFNGSSNFIDSNPIPLTGTSTQSLTWACWVSSNAASGDILNMVYPTSGWNMCPFYASGQIFYARVWSTAAMSAGSTFTLNRYYYLTLVRNNATNTNSFYVDGNLVASQTGVAYASSGNANNHYFGRAGAQATNTYFNGKISNAQIYTRALSESEVLNNFNAHRGRYGI